MYYNVIELILMNIRMCCVFKSPSLEATSANIHHYQLFVMYK